MKGRERDGEEGKIMEWMEFFTLWRSAGCFKFNFFNLSPSLFHPSLPLSFFLRPSFSLVGLSFSPSISCHISLLFHLSCIQSFPCIIYALFFRPSLWSVTILFLIVLKLGCEIEWFLFYFSIISSSPSVSFSLPPFLSLSLPRISFIFIYFIYTWRDFTVEFKLHMCWIW